MSDKPFERFKKAALKPKPGTGDIFHFKKTKQEKTLDQELDELIGPKAKNKPGPKPKQ